MRMFSGASRLGLFGSSCIRLCRAAGCLAVAIMCSTNFARADENGISFWLPGLFGSLAAVPQQQPGWALATINYYTNVSASGAVAASREITVGRFNATARVNLNVNVNANADV